MRHVLGAPVRRSSFSPFVFFLRAARASLHRGRAREMGGWTSGPMPAEQPHRSPRRRRLEVSSELLVRALAVAGLCLSGLHLRADAFVPSAVPAWRPRLASRHIWRATTPPPATYSEDSETHRSVMNVLGESPSAACRRALQRAWRASSSEATIHEQV